MLETQRHPRPRLFFPPTVRETRPWGGCGAQILTLKRSHTAVTLHFCRVAYVIQLFDTSVRICGIPSTVFRRGQEDLGRGSAQREDAVGGTRGVISAQPSVAFPGLSNEEWRLVLSALVFSSIQPSKSTPFRGGLVDGRRRSGRGVGCTTILTPIGMEG